MRRSSISASTRPQCLLPRDASGARSTAALDDIEGYRADDPDRSLYSRNRADVTMPDGHLEQAWVYFYNAPLGRAQRIASGDYLEHVKVR